MSMLVKTIHYTDFVGAGGGAEAYAPLYTLAAGDVLFGVSMVTTVSFNDSSDTNYDVVITGGGNRALEASTATKTAETAEDGMFPIAQGFIASQYDALVGTPALSPVDLSVYAAEWQADGNAGQLNVYLVVATPTIL